jgi:thiol-disulfide isomerase/thioredoxin
MPSPVAPQPTVPKPADASWRLHALLLVAVLLVGGALLVRFLLPMDAKGRAIQALHELGAETELGALTASELDQPMEGPPGTKGPRKLRDAIASGDVILLHFWASWCPPCLEELPELTTFAASMRNRKLTVVAVAYDDAWADADAALIKATGQTRPAPIQWWRDPAGQEGDPKAMLRLHFGTEQLPETYVLVGGKVVARLIAGQAWNGPKMVQALQLLAPAREESSSRGASR